MNQKVKPQLEKIIPGFGSSFTLRKFESTNPNDEAYWHFHPELEIVYIEDGSGKRHIGSHISYYKKGDLIMIGPNLPHFGFTDRLAKSQNEIVIQMKQDFLGKTFFDIPEMVHVKRLFERSQSGIRFHGNTKRWVGERMNDMVHMNHVERLTTFLTILNDLATTEEYTNLNAGSLGFNIQPQDNERIRLIYRYVRENFQDEISIAEVAQLISMTEPAFCRYFKKVTKKTFISFLNEFRVVHACKLLAEEHMSVSDICFAAGFNNFSHFAKNFKKITGHTPSGYRQQLGLLVY
ncbi:AraC family transcriptional regulator [Membranihabitans marinus]|uniref:AraC family transcriptional regulator n=1 Tax=Membranihabitans marinus TaxID=1227546 RepID=UPI001F247924|nr:AraC family transcriptional regulator [Membranihabitans marinus]